MFNRKSQKVWELVDQHYDYVYECYTNFEKFIGDYLSGQKIEESSKDFKKIDELEGLADHTRRALVNAFLEGSLLPTTRKEILQIVERVDKIANRCQDVSRQMIYENAYIPELMKTGILEIIKLTKEQFTALSRALEILFSNYDQLIKDNSILNDLKLYESKVDEIELNLIKALYASELALAEKNHAKYFLCKIADLSDMMEDIADEIQIMVVMRKV